MGRVDETLGCCGFQYTIMTHSQIANSPINYALNCMQPEILKNETWLKSKKIGKMRTAATTTWIIQFRNLEDLLVDFLTFHDLAVKNLLYRKVLT